MVWSLLTEQEDAVAESTGAVGLHGDVEDGRVPADHADAVVPLRPAEHTQQLLGDQAVQGRDGGHGQQKGQEGVHLPGRRGGG